MGDLETEAKPDYSLWRSLKVRTTVFTLVIFVLSISALSIFINRSLQADMEQLLGEQQFSVVTSIAEKVDHELTERLKALQTVAKADAALLARPATLQARLEQRPLMQLMFNGGIFVTGLDGVSIASVPLSIEGSPSVGINYLDRDFVITALRDGKNAIGKPVMGRLKTDEIGPALVKSAVEKTAQFSSYSRERQQPRRNRDCQRSIGVIHF